MGAVLPPGALHPGGECRPTRTRVREDLGRAGSGALKSVDEEISNQSATSDLRAMVHAGLLRQQGKKRGTFYEADAPLVDIRTRVRADLRPLDASLLFATAAGTVG